MGGAIEQWIVCYSIAKSMKIKQKWYINEQRLQLKMKILLGYNLKIVVYREEVTFYGGGRKKIVEGVFPGGGMSNFLTGVVRGTPPIPQ